MTEMTPELEKCYECYKAFAKGNPDFDSCRHYQDSRSLGLYPSGICGFIKTIYQNLASVKSGAVKRGEKEITLVAVVERLVEEGF